MHRKSIELIKCAKVFLKNVNLVTYCRVHVHIGSTILERMVCSYVQLYMRVAHTFIFRIIFVFAGNILKPFFDMYLHLKCLLDLPLVRNSMNKCTMSVSCSIPVYSSNSKTPAINASLFTLVAALISVATLSSEVF